MFYAKHPAIKIFVILILIIVPLSLGYFLGVAHTLMSAESQEFTVTESDKRISYTSDDVDFSLFWDVWETLQTNYYTQPVNELDLLYGAISGMVAGLHDPHSIFLTPDNALELGDELSGNFQGIGAEIGERNGQLSIVTPLPGSPAEMSGLLPGDKILAIDGEDSSFLSIDEAVYLIRGEKGTPVVLTVLSRDETISRDVTVIRDDIHVESVTSVYDPEDGIYTISLNNFNTDTVELFRTSVLEAITVTPKGIILDLRNNPGGFLDAAVDVSGYWTGDKVVVIEKASETVQSTYVAGFEPLLKGIPTIVLINQGSASASEIVAGALQDYEYATIVGEQSFGKGTVQVLEDLRGGAAVKYTVAEWLTPFGTSIEGQGIVPDVVIPLTTDDIDNERDPQMDKAIELLIQ